MTGKIFSISVPKRSDWQSAWRAFMKLALPMTVLISPLWAMKRLGWARDQLGKVFVEKRVCISASADS